MSLDPALWAKLHGASTHFPVALALVAAFFDGLAFTHPRSPERASLHAAGRLTLLLGALGTIPAVLSGVFLTRGEVLGHDALLFHHLFVWPAFAAIVGLSLWRRRIDEEKRKVFAAYVALLFLAGGLMTGAGYWGGEMMLNATETPLPQATPEVVAKGRTMFLMSCSQCHGDDARGDEGPDLHGLAIGDARIAATIKNGIKGEMPTFAKKYDDGEIAVLVVYLDSLR